MAEVSVRVCASVRPSIKTMQGMMTIHCYTSLLHLGRTLVSGFVKFFYTFEEGHPDRGR